MFWLIVFHVCIKNKARSYFVCSLRFGFERCKRDLAYSKWKKKHTLFPLYRPVHFVLMELFWFTQVFHDCLIFSTIVIHGYLSRYSEESCSINLFPGSCTEHLIAAWHSYCYILLFYAIYCHFMGYLVECLRLKRVLHGLTKAEEIVFTDTRKILFTHCKLFSIGKGASTCSGTSQGLWVSHQCVQTQLAGFCCKHVQRQDVLFLF